jgi:hypothetical protein
VIILVIHSSLNGATLYSYILYCMSRAFLWLMFILTILVLLIYSLPTETRYAYSAICMCIVLLHRLVFVLKIFLFVNILIEQRVMSILTIFILIMHSLFNGTLCKYMAVCIHIVCLCLLFILSVHLLLVHSSLNDTL